MNNTNTNSTQDVQLPAPYCREAGEGPGVVCLHANAGTSSQWRSLMDRLAPNFRVLAPDSFGVGGSPAWPAERKPALGEEVSLLEPVFKRAGESFSLVGHSYGASIAMMAALRRTGQVRAMAVYEPTLFALLEHDVGGREAVKGIRAVAGDVAAFVSKGDHASAARRFLDYWMGNGTWDAIPDARRAPIAASMVNSGAWSKALFMDQTPLSAFRALEIPILYMTGAESPASSLEVARVLTEAIPNVVRVVFPGLGHMGPVTHPEVVNNAVAEFLHRHGV